jgi:hypothetical protein
MHLPKLPTIFVKDGVERKAFYTVEARELVAAGWVEKGEEKPQPKIAAKPAAKPAEEKPKVEKPKTETEGPAK